MSLQGPQGSVDKPFLWTEGRVNLKASLNKSAYTHGENVNVTIDVKNDSRKVVRKIRVSFNLLKRINFCFTISLVELQFFSLFKSSHLCLYTHVDSTFMSQYDAL